MALEAEVARLRAARTQEPSRTRSLPDADPLRMRVAVLHPQTAFVRGGAETHAEGLVRALRAAGHDADLVQIAGKWYPASQLAHQMAVWRSFDITESNGLKVDAVVGLKFPAYLVEHERKIVWLMHQHRTAYELWDHPVYADLSRQEDGPAVRDMVWNADRLSLNEAKRVFTNSKNVKDRLWSSLRIPAEVLYHPSPVMEHLMDETSGPLGDYVLFPSRMESLKRQSLVIDAMQHVRSAVTLVLVGKGPDEQALRDQVERLGLQQRVRFEIDVTDARLFQLYEEALAVYYGPFDEDYGYVTLEGFAADRPVVTLADSGGPLEFVVDGETGLVAAPEPKADRRRVRPAVRRSRPGGASGRGGERARPHRGPALAGRRGAVARLMLHDIVRNAPTPHRSRRARIRRGAGVLGSAPAGPDGRGHVRPRGPGRPAPDRVLRPAPDGRDLADRAQGHASLARLPPRRVRARQQRRVPPGGVSRRLPRAGVADRAARPRARRLRPRAAARSATRSGFMATREAAALRIEPHAHRTSFATSRSAIRGARTSLGELAASSCTRRSARRYLEEFGCRTPVFVVPHPIVESEADMRQGGRSRPRAARRSSRRAACVRWSSRPAT